MGVASHTLWDGPLPSVQQAALDIHALLAEIDRLERRCQEMKYASEKYDEVCDTTTYQCDNPSCVEMVEDSREWWHVRIQKGGLDWTVMFGNGLRHDLCFCSPGCMEFALRCIELTEIARDA